MRSFTAVLGAAALLAASAAQAPASPIRDQPPRRVINHCKPHAAHGPGITFTNPLCRSRGEGAGRGLL
jgi:hypothetical protein